MFYFLNRYFLTLKIVVPCWIFLVDVVQLYLYWEGIKKNPVLFGICLKWENHPLPSDTRPGTVSMYKCGPEATLANLTKCRFAEGAVKPCYEGLVKQEKAVLCLRAASWNLHTVWNQSQPLWRPDQIRAGLSECMKHMTANSSFSRNTPEPCLVCSDVLTPVGSILVPCPECSLMKQVQVCALAGSQSRGVGKAGGQLGVVIPAGLFQHFVLCFFLSA